MIIYPAIDLKGGRVVRLEQGKAERETVYFNDPAEPARLWRDAGAGWMHVVDLDGAFTGENHNLAALRRVAEMGLRIQFGGGMRDLDRLATAFDHGVTRAVIGTRAAEDPEFLRSAIERFGGERIALGIDARDGLVTIKGWVAITALEAVQFARDAQAIGLRYVIYTDISRDGMMKGPNFEALVRLLEAVDLEVIASGGVHALSDIERLREMRASHANLNGVITGKALYENAFSLKDALAAVR